MANFKMVQEFSGKAYFLPLPEYGYEVVIKGNQLIDETSKLGKALLKYYGENVQYEGETKSLMEKVASGDIGGTSLTTEQTAALGKIDGLEASASEIDATVNADFEVGMTIDTTVSSSKYGFDLHHKSQQGLASDRIAFTIHNYTDSKTMQLDNVGSGDILRLKNAHNSINRPDKDENYTGDGKFLVLENASGEQLRVFNSGEWYFNYVPINLIQTKADDGNYAVVIKSLTEHVKAFDFGFLKIWLGTTSATMKFSKEPLYQINNVNIMKLQTDRAYFYEKLQLAKGIMDKNGSTGTAGQVLTALGDGTCVWQTPL